MDTPDQNPVPAKTIKRRKPMTSLAVVEQINEDEDAGDMYSLLNKLEEEMNDIINKGDHNIRNFEVKRYIENIRKSGQAKRSKKYLSLISSRVPGRLIRIVRNIRDLIVLSEDDGQ